MRYINKQLYNILNKLIHSYIMSFTRGKIKVCNIDKMALDCKSLI